MPDCLEKKNYQCIILKKQALQNIKCAYLYPVENITPDSKILVELVQTKMPYGKYKGTLISDLPVYYLEWLQTKGFPPGKLGMLLSTAYEIKINGLNTILIKVKQLIKPKS